MPKITDFLKSLGQKAGIAETDEAFTSLIGNESFAGVELPAEIATAFDSGLVALADAHRNPSIIARAMPDQWRRSVEGIIATAGDKLTISELENFAIKDKIHKGTDIQEVFAILLENNEKTVTKRNGATVDEQVKLLQSEKDVLRGQLLDYKKANEVDRAELLKRIETERIEMQIQTMCEKEPIINVGPNGLEFKDMYPAIKSAIYSAMEADGAVLRMSNNVVSLFSVSDPNLPWTENGKTSGFQSYVQKVLAAKNFLNKNANTSSISSNYRGQLSPTQTDSGGTSTRSLNKEKSLALQAYDQSMSALQ